MIYDVFVAILETFLIFGFGAWLRWKGILREEMQDNLNRLALDFFFPLLTFATITGTFRADDWGNMLILPAAGVVMIAIGAALGFVFRSWLWCRTPERVRTFHHICAVNNYVFLPLIVLEHIGTERHIALLLVMNIGSTIGFWTFGIMTLNGKQSLRDTLRGIWSVNLAAVFVALFFAALQIPGYAPLAQAIRRIGDLTVPFMLLLIGGSLLQCRGEFFLHKRDIAVVSLVRLVILPAIFAVLLWGIPLDADVKLVLLVVALMPMSCSSVLVVRRYGGSEGFAGQGVIVTTILSLMTIPLLVWAFRYFS